MKVKVFFNFKFKVYNFMAFIINILRIIYFMFRNILCRVWKVEMQTKRWKITNLTDKKLL